jgi:hypothetical protein
MKDTILDIIEELESNRRKINPAQKKMLKEKYNYITGGFDYAVDNWGGLIIECDDSTFRNIEYYLGFEYERDNQELFIKSVNKILVLYAGGKRVDKLVSQLEELEEVTV